MTQPLHVFRGKRCIHPSNREREAVSRRKGVVVAHILKKKGKKGKGEKENGVVQHVKRVAFLARRVPQSHNIRREEKRKKRVAARKSSFRQPHLKKRGIKTYDKGEKSADH